MKRIVVASSVLALALTACGGGGSSPVPVSGGVTLTGQQVRAQVTIVIPPKSTSKARPRYVSPSTQSVSVAVDSGTPTTANLTASSSNCTTPAPLSPLTCTVPITASVGSHSFTFITYDGTNATGNVLSQNTVTQTVVVNQLNNIAVTLNGVPASFSVTPVTAAGMAVEGGAAVGFSMTDGVAIPFIISALDADGNAIVGPGAPTINASITGTNASNFTLAAATNGNPNQYSITSAAGGKIATLALSSTPLAQNIALASGPFYATVMTNAQLGSPSFTITALAAGSAGTMYADYNNGQSGSIVSFNPSTPNTPPTTLSTGTFIQPPLPPPVLPPIVINGAVYNAGILVYNSSTQNVYFHSYYDCTVDSIAGSGSTGLATLVAGSGCGADANGTGSGAKFNYPVGMTADASGNLFVAEGNGCSIREVTIGGAVTTVAGGSCGTGTDNPIGTSATFHTISAITFDSSNGKLYVSDDCTVRSIDPSSSFAVVTIAGIIGNCTDADGTGSAGHIATINGIVYDASDGNLYVNTNICSFRRISIAGVVSTVNSNTHCSGPGTDGFNGTLYTLQPLVYNPSDGALYIPDALPSIRKVIP